MIGDFHFLRPWWLASLLPVIGFIWLAARSNDVRSRWKTLIAPHLLTHLIVESTDETRFRPYQLMGLLMFVGAIAAAGPTWQRELPPFVENTAPLAIAVDLSATMDAIDITPSRLERAKLKIKGIVASRDGARTAIIAYAGTAHSVLPFTDDTALIQTYVDALSTRIMPVPGKNSTVALRLAEAALAGEDTSGTILFMTDGIEERAFPAFGSKTKDSIVVLGIGTAEGGPVKLANGGFLNQSNGARTFARLDVEAFKKLHSDTGADVATITADDKDVRWVTQHIRFHFDQKRADSGDRWRDLGWWLSIPIAALFAMSFRRGWVVRLGCLFLSVQLLMGADRLQAAEWHFADAWLTPDQQGQLAFDRGDYLSAAAYFRDPLWRGTALYRAGKFDEAIDAFAAQNSAESYYGQGNSFLRLLKFEEAVAAYKQALSIRKDWPDAQFNLAIAEKLLAAKKQNEDEKQQDPNQAPDKVEFDEKGKKGKEGQMNIAEQTSEMWMKNIQVSPADLMARKFAIEAKGSKQ